MNNFNFMSYGSQKYIDLNTLKKVEGCIARTEDSGSEGYYTEIARWNPKVNKFQKYAFCKFLGGEIEDTNDLTCANKVTEELNKVWGENNSLIHYLESWSGE